ncbi:MAG: sulfotransferase, partial [Anaerolineae bacterium]
MIPFNFRLFFRLSYLSLVKSRGTHARLTRKRVLFLVGFFAIFVPGQLINGMFLLLDWILFPGFRHVEVREPVFIVGNPRTGSTHLLRVLARDEQTFASAKLWELVLAPSITQRKIVRALAGLDRRLGSPVRKWLVGWQKRAFQEAGQYHRLRLEEPDEDELNLLPIFSAIHLAFAFPFMEEFRRYILFDSEVPPAEKARFMAFYRRSMQRTLY